MCQLKTLLVCVVVGVIHVRQIYVRKLTIIVGLYRDRRKSQEKLTCVNKGSAALSGAE